MALHCVVGPSLKPTGSASLQPRSGHDSCTDHVPVDPVVPGAACNSRPPGVCPALHLLADCEYGPSVLSSHCTEFAALDTTSCSIEAIELHLGSQAAGPRYHSSAGHTPSVLKLDQNDYDYISTSVCRWPRAEEATSSTSDIVAEYTELRDSSYSEVTPTSPLDSSKLTCSLITSNSHKVGSPEARSRPHPLPAGMGSGYNLSLHGDCDAGGGEAICYRSPKHSTARKQNPDRNHKLPGARALRRASSAPVLALHNRRAQCLSDKVVPLPFTPTHAESSSVPSHTRLPTRAGTGSGSDATERLYETVLSDRYWVKRSESGDLYHDPVELYRSFDS